MGLINVNSLNFTYPQRKQKAVDDISFVIERGSYTAFVGFNGSGKSTVARLLCGLEKPDSGTIEIEKSHRIGIVFQSPKDQLVSGIVSRDTEFGPQNLGLSAGEIELRTIESLNIVDMLDRAGSSTSALSLGQTQKVALSGVIALRPDILILDEAVSMLDPSSRKDILEFIRYWHKCGNTIIQITHDMEIVKEADNVIGMENGKIFFYGTKNAFLNDPNNVKRIEGNPLPKSTRLIKTSSPSDISLSLKNINFVYNKNDEKQHGVSHININFKKGSITALTGHSGAGKSTILELAAGLLKGEGEIITVDGKRPVLAQQNARAALFESFAADDVAFGPRNQGKSGKQLREIVKKAMDDSSILFDDFAERRTFCLSGGEQRRLSIAGILALDADVILFDEPTAGLDSITRYNVMSMFRKLADEGRTIIFSTHHRDEADFADREITMSKGLVVGDTDSDFNSITYETGIKISAYESAGMVEGLQKASLSLTGAGKTKKSFIEKLPAIVRIILFLLLFISSLSFRSIFLCGGMVLISVLYCKLAGFSLKKLFSACIKILPFLLLFSIFQMVFYPALPDEVRFTTWKWFMVTPSKLLFCGATILRTVAALSCISGFFISTPEYDLIDGLKILLWPFAIIKLPVRYLILIIEVIFRFIPLLVDEATSILKTQMIRGGLGKAEKTIDKIKAVIPLIAPLIIQTIKKSEALADAITMRCFS